MTTGASSEPTRGQRMLRQIARLRIRRLRGLYSRINAFNDDSNREFQVDFFGLNYCGTLAQYVDRQIFYFGSYSLNELMFLRRAAELLRSRRPSVSFVDIGANVGQHSLFMARLVNHVIAFEPNDQVADRLQANVLRNGLQNVQLFRVAVGDLAGEGQLGSGLQRNSGSRSLVWSLDVAMNTPVEIVRGDTALESAGLDRLDILKIDVEGYEKNVFSGLRNILHRDRPIILFELVGQEVKGGFASAQELRETLYPNAVLFTLSKADQPRLLPFDWGAEEAVCLPRELVGLFHA